MPALPSPRGAGGLALAAGGAALWTTTLDGPFLGCTDAGFGFGAGGLRACDEALGSHVAARWLGAVSLMTLGGLSASAGVGVYFVPSLRGSALGVDVPLPVRGLRR